MMNICKELGMKYPIIQGGMGNISNAILTSAVSEAGGLGTIGCGTMTPDQVSTLITDTKQRTDKPFAVNIAINVTPYVDELIDIVTENEIPIVSLSAGNPAPYIPILQEKGIKVLTIVASVKHAQKAKTAGANAVVAEGFEAAGINSNLELTTMTLIPQIVKHVDIPIIAAGGIGDGKGLAAALMLGAQAVQMGTRFIATKEAPFHPNYKNAVLQATDTTAQIIGRTVGQTRRVLKSDYRAKIMQKEASGQSLSEFTALTTEEKHITGAIDGNLSAGFINGGQVAGLIDSMPTVKELLESMMKDAKAQVNHVQEVLQ